MWHDENVFLLAEFGSVSVCLLEHFQVIFMSRYILTLLALVAVGKKTLLSWSFWLWMLSYPGISCLWCHWWFDYLSSLMQLSWAGVNSHWLHLLLMIKKTFLSFRFWLVRCPRCSRLMTTGLLLNDRNWKDNAHSGCSQKGCSQCIRGFTACCIFLSYQGLLGKCSKTPVTEIFR